MISGKTHLTFMCVSFGTTQGKTMDNMGQNENMSVWFWRELSVQTSANEWSKVVDTLTPCLYTQKYAKTTNWSFKLKKKNVSVTWLHSIPAGLYNWMRNCSDKLFTNALFALLRPLPIGDCENAPLPLSAASAFSHGIASPIPAVSESGKV